MIYRLEISHKLSFDPISQTVLADIQQLGIGNIKDVKVVNVYFVEGNITLAQAQRIGQELLVDPIVETCRVLSKPEPWKLKSKGRIVEVSFNTGVMDPTEASTLKGIRDLGIEGVVAVRTAKQYHVYGNVTEAQLATITNRVLMNKLIQHAITKPPKGFAPLSINAQPATRVDIATVDLLTANDKKLLEISQKGQLYLNINEMRTIQAYFKKEKRNPTDVELETVAQTWSEHCHHKTFRGLIRYSTVDGKKKTSTVIRNLLKSTIARATHELNKPWCVSVFHDNAGVIAFDDTDHVCFKVETHNHPSALEPFGGANTGVGGVIRDTLGTGLAAKPLCNTDVFCFAPPDLPYGQLPPGTLHPRRVYKGVVSGVRDYGNKMGIPTVNGAIVFDPKFVANPLVFCGNVGLIPKGKEIKKVNDGDLILAVGGRTGRDGIHGATFSSGELTSESETVSSGAVQIGNPIEEKKVLDALLKARDAGLYSAITDCGAGGFSSAVGEMGAQTGADVRLDLAPLKYQGLKYHEIWISESQERMILSVPPKNIKKILEIFDGENVEAVVIGTFTGKRLRLSFKDVMVCDLDMDFIHEGIPEIIKEAVYMPATVKKERLPAQGDLTQGLCAALNHFNVASKESVIRVYDHEVQGTSIIKPMVGIACDGPSDAAVIRPKLDSAKGIAISNGINVRYGMIDPYHMATSCIDEAIRQVISVGGNLERIALLDNFCWGNPDKPDRLGGLVRCAQGCYDAAIAFGTPFISGKDSLYNEYTESGKSMAIPGTILISAIGIVDDVRRTITMDFKKPGNRIYIAGKTYDEMGGSIYLDNLGQLGGTVPVVRFKDACKNFAAMQAAIKDGCIVAAHDCSEGGIAVALAEMAFAGGLGAYAMLKNVPYEGKLKRSDVVAFSESNSRFIVEVPVEKEATFKRYMKDVAHGAMGTVESSPELIVYGIDDKPVINAPIDQLKEVWQKPLQHV